MSRPSEQQRRDVFNLMAAPSLLDALGLFQSRDLAGVEGPASYGRAGAADLVLLDTREEENDVVSRWLTGPIFSVLHFFCKRVKVRQAGSSPMPFPAPPSPWFVVSLLQRRRADSSPSTPLDALREETPLQRPGKRPRRPSRPPVLEQPVQRRQPRRGLAVRRRRAAHLHGHPVPGAEHGTQAGPGLRLHHRVLPRPEHAQQGPENRSLCGYGSVSRTFFDLPCIVPKSSLVAQTWLLTVN